MPWKYVGTGQHIGAGVPARDMEDDEWAEVNAMYDLQFPDDQGSLERCGLYVKEPAGKGGAVPVTPPPSRPAGQEEVTDNG